VLVVGSLAVATRADAFTNECSDVGVWDIDSCERLDAMLAVQEVQANDQQMIWVGVWLIGGVFFGLWFGTRLWSEFRRFFDGR